ncbi:MAG: hypothetical protein DMG23_15400 [Acidobacteria bacterium]|nr:MAG: hypothetical protein DMG23_15400 [Acidobacteriota bacterium]
MLFGIVIRRRKMRLATSLLFLIGLVSFFLAAASCGGGGSSPPLPTPHPPVTFTITVQASVAGVSTTKTLGTLTITVN